MKSKVTDIVMSDNTNCQLYRNITKKYLHTNSRLNYESYKFIGEATMNEIEENDTICTVDAYAYRARHQQTGVIKHLRNGSYVDKLTGKQMHLKLCAILRGSSMFLLICKANSRVSDIAPMAPLRVNGMSQLYELKRRFSFRAAKQKSA